VGEDQLEVIPLLKVSFYARGNAGRDEHPVSGYGPGLVLEQRAFFRCCRHSFDVSSLLPHADTGDGCGHALHLERNG
jgi:hypothetical protein